jgi:hypothetical protein
MISSQKIDIFVDLSFTPQTNPSVLALRIFVKLCKRIHRSVISLEMLCGAQCSGSEAKKFTYYYFCADKTGNKNTYERMFVKV